jgi:hypothetical protein
MRKPCRIGNDSDPAPMRMVIGVIIVAHQVPLAHPVDHGFWHKRRRS